MLSNKLCVSINTEVSKKRFNFYNINKYIKLVFKLQNQYYEKHKIVNAFLSRIAVAISGM